VDEELEAEEDEEVERRRRTRRWRIVCSAEIRIDKGYTPEECGLKVSLDKTNFHNSTALKGLCHKMHKEVKIYSQAMASVMSGGHVSPAPKSSKRKRAAPPSAEEQQQAPRSRAKPSAEAAVDVADAAAQLQAQTQQAQQARKSCARLRNLLACA